MKRIVLGICLLLVVGCCKHNTTSNGNGINYVHKGYSMELKSGQRVVYVAYKDFDEWLKAHNDIRIDTMTSIDKEGYGVYYGIVVVYTPSVEKTK